MSPGKDPRGLDRILATRAARGHRALVAGTVGRDGEISVSGSAADGPPPDGAALFEIGSITKVFTGVLLAEMHLRGEVRLDDPLSMHLPAPRPRPPKGEREPTLRQLATHRSGLPNVPGRLGRRELLYTLGFGEQSPWSRITQERFAALVEAEQAQRPRFARTRYSSLAVGLLGDALAHRANRPYEQLLRERVLEPLGMHDTHVTVAANDTPRLLSGHSRRGRPRPPIEPFMTAAGGLRSSADDLLRFAAACLRPSPQTPGPALALAQRPHLRTGRRIATGLCWRITEPRGGSRVVWHNGGTWGFRSFLGFTPDTGTAAVVLSNAFRGVEGLGFTLATSG